MIGFFSNPKSITINPSPKNHSRLLVSTIDEDKACNILSLLPKKCPEEIQKLEYNGMLKGKIDISINPTILKHFFLAINGVFYEEQDEQFIDKFISETFRNSKKTQDINISDLLNKIRYNIKYNHNVPVS